jgi:hypothetical protein
MPVGARFEQALNTALASSGVSGSAGNFFPLLDAINGVELGDVLRNSTKVKLYCQYA